MITGFNTDIQHKGVTYHVQTEDKGLDSPLILSLVYVGGAIIASKRTPYEDLVASGFDEQALTERLQRQHKLICAAIKAGRVEDLKRMGGQSGAAAQPEHAAQNGHAPAEGAKATGQKRKKTAPVPVADAEAEKDAAPAPVEAAPSPVEVAPAPVKVVPPPAEVAPPPVKAPLEVRAEKRPEVAAGAESGRAGRAGGKTAEPEIIILTTLADEINALEDFRPRQEPPTNGATAPLSHAAAEVPPVEPEPIPVVPLVEAEILEEPPDSSGEIYLKLLDDEGEFRAGQLVTVKVHVGRGTYGQRPVADALVTVKVLGTSFRPIILTATTDAYGVAVVRALLPRFTSGRAAIIIRAVDGEDSAEMRRIIHQ